MKKFSMTAFVAGLALWAAHFGWADGPGSPAVAKTITVVAISDFHGELEPTYHWTANRDNPQAVPNGGAAYLSSYINIVRAKAAEESARTGVPRPVFVLDAGDLFQGTLVSNTAEGEPVIRFFNYLGVLGSTLGNHDFDFGPVGSQAVPMREGDDPQGALKARIAEARFPMLAANVVDHAGRTPAWLRRSVLVEAGGVKIGIVGAASEETPRTTQRRNLVGLRFLNPLNPVLREATLLRRQGAQAVILVIHEGSACYGQVEANDACYNGAFFTIARELARYRLVDLMIGGHTHNGAAFTVGRMGVIEPYAHGSNIQLAEIPLDNPKAPVRVSQPTPVCGAFVHGPHGPTCAQKIVESSQGPVGRAEFMGEPVQPDPNVIRLLAADFERVRKIKEAPLGVRAIKPIPRSFESFESAMSNLVVDAMKAVFPRADVAVTNPRGVRDEFPAGNLTYGHLFEVLPFDNQLALVAMDGKTLAQLVQAGHASSGLTWSGLTYSATGCRVTSIEINGRPLAPTASYRVVTNDYLAEGGSAFGSIRLKPEQIQIFWDPKFILRDVVGRSIQKNWPTLQPETFYDPASPRQRVTGKCRSGN